jgi:hypothetical protein
MTTIAIPTEAIQAAPRRVLSVTRLHFVNRWQILYLPLLILCFIFLVDLAIWWLILTAQSSAHDRHSAEKGLNFTGSIFYIYVYVLIIAIQAVNRTFPFALGFGVTRRNYYLGTSAAFFGVGVVFSAILTVGSVIENATGGWGIGGHFFTTVYFHDGSWGLRFVIFLLLFLFAMFFGSAAASVFVRWKATGLTVFFGALALLLLGAVALITLNNGWLGFWGWFGEAGSLGVALWSLVPTAIAAVAGYFILQRATPKS